MPSGTVEDGETLDAALVREVEEETGLTVATVDAYPGSFDYRPSSGRRARQFTFATSCAPGPVVLAEHDESSWCGPGADLPVSVEVGDVLIRWRTSRPCG